MSDCCEVPPVADIVREVCPRCGTKGRSVDSITVKALAAPDALRAGVPTAPRFCEDVDCGVVYFDTDSAVEESGVTVPVFAKHPNDDSSPVCYCFAFTRGDVRRAVEARSPLSQAITAEVRAGHCACEVKNPRGACCLGDVTKIEKETSREGFSDSSLPTEKKTLY